MKLQLVVTAIGKKWMKSCKEDGFNWYGLPVLEELEKNPYYLKNDMIYSLTDLISILKEIYFTWQSEHGGRILMIDMELLFINNYVGLKAISE